MYYILVKEDTLTDMVSHLSEKVGLVHQFPSMMDGKLEFSRVIEKVCRLFLVLAVGVWQ